MDPPEVVVPVSTLIAIEPACMRDRKSKGLKPEATNIP